MLLSSARSAKQLCKHKKAVETTEFQQPLFLALIYT